VLIRSWSWIVLALRNRVFARVILAVFYLSIARAIEARESDDRIITSTINSQTTSKISTSARDLLVQDLPSDEIVEVKGIQLQQTNAGLQVILAGWREAPRSIRRMSVGMNRQWLTGSILSFNIFF
jgi:hypothetical protein